MLNEEMFDLIFNTLSSKPDHKSDNFDHWMYRGIEALELQSFKKLIIQGRSAVWLYPDGKLITVIPETREITQKGVAEILIQMYDII